MNSIFCIVISMATIVGGCLALYIGARGDLASMAAKVGGIFIAVIGVLGLIACLISK